MYRSVCKLMLALTVCVLLGSGANAQFNEKINKKTNDKTLDTAPAIPIAGDELQRALSLLTPATGWSITPDQKAAFDTKLWNLESLTDGSEIFTLLEPKPSVEQKRVILRDKGVLSSVSAYTLDPLQKGAMKEQSSSVVFHKGRLYALTQCSDNGDKAGRDCLTVTKNVCEFVNQPQRELPAKVSDELKVVEVRALATILTLRGVNHQLENVAKHGNRMGLKDPMQTTKGKLIAKDQAKAKSTRQRALELCRTAALNRDDAKIAALVKPDAKVAGESAAPQK